MKMIKPLFFIAVLCCQLTAVQAQDPKHENHMQDVPAVENEYFTVEFANVHCQLGFAMGKMKITNKTADYLVFDQSKIKGNFEFGNLENEKGREIYIDPYGSSNKNFKFTGPNMHVEKFSIDVEAFSKLPVQGTVQEGNMFVIPPQTNDIVIGSFSCKFDKMTKKTDKLSTQFKCTYNGSDIGIVDETKASFIYPNDNEYANAQNKQKLVLMERGEEKKFSFECSEHKSDGDLQFIEMKIKWNNVFVESKKVEIAPFHVDFQLDAAKTAASNK